MSIPKRLRAARKATALNRKALSVAAGLSQNIVQGIETASQIPCADSIERLAVVLAVSPSWLAFAEEHPTPPDIGERSGGISQRLREAREARAMSLRAVGAAAGITGAAVHAIEKGPTIPQVDTVEKIAKALRIYPGWLAFGEGTMLLENKS